MGKYKTTRKQIKAMYPRIFQCGYRELQTFGFSPVAYTCGVYGWNYDVISLGDGVAITTGYRAMIGAELPEAARRILRNAEKYDIEQMKQNKKGYISAEENAKKRKQIENYKRIACRRFIAILKGAAK